MACQENNEVPPTVVINIERNVIGKLHLAFTTTCEKFISCVKFSQMKKNFKVIYKENPESLKNVHDQLCSQMKSSIMEDLNDLCKEQFIDILLDSLEALNKKQESSKHSWRPSGDPKEDLKDHIYPLKLKHKEDLENILTKLQLFNEKLVNETSVNHAEILHLKKSNDELCKVFSNITSSLMGTNLKNLQNTLHDKFEQACSDDSSHVVCM